ATLQLIEAGAVDAGAALAEATLRRPGLEPVARARLLLGRAYARVGIDRVLAVEDYEAVTALVPPDSIEAAKAALGLGTLLPPAQGRVVLERALRLYERLDVRIGQANTHRSLALTLLRTGDLDAAGDAAAEAVRLQRLDGHRAGLIEALDAMATVAHQHRDHDAAASLWHEALQLAREQGSKRLASLCYAGLGAIAAEQGQLPEAEAWALQATELQRAVGWRDLLASSLGVLGHLRMMRGRLAEARSALVESLDLAARIGLHRISRDEGVLAVVEARDGRLGEARRHVARVRDAMHGARTPWRVDVLVLEAEVALHCGERALARERMGDAWALANEIGLQSRFPPDLAERLERESDLAWIVDL
ncbi:MAG: hypothetical protein R3F59_36610, partial [Myxococcota bacterium]